MQSHTATLPDLTSATPLRVPRARSARNIGRIEVFESPADALEAWGELEERCPASIYQTRRFLLPWIEAFAPSLKITPMLVVARDAAETPVAFLPLGVRRYGACRAAGFLGGKDSNANLGLFSPDVNFTRDDLASLLRGAAVKARPRPDLFVLESQPRTWNDEANRLDIFDHQPSASYLHGGAINPLAAPTVTARLSKDTAKKLRKKRQKLETMGAVSHIVAEDDAGARRIIDAFFEQKLARFRDKRIDSVFERPEARAFIEAASRPGANGAPAMEMHALTLDDRIIATYGGGGHRGRLHLMINSFDADTEISRCSPGDLLLLSILERKRAEAYSSFDLGIGEARYKDSWCDETIEMFDSVVPVTRMGHVQARFESGRLNAKRWIKRSDWALPFFRRLLRK